MTGIRMTIIRSENIKPFDCDETLVLHNINNPAYSELPLIQVDDAVTGGSIEVRVNENMVRLLEEEKSRGATVVVWSRGGYQWAADVVKALDINLSVDIIMSKPTFYFDDTPVEKWMESRVYLTPETSYKNLTKE